MQSWLRRFNEVTIFMQENDQAKGVCFVLFCFVQYCFFTVIQWRSNVGLHFQYRQCYHHHHQQIKSIKSNQIKSNIGNDKIPSYHENIAPQSIKSSPLQFHPITRSFFLFFYWITHSFNVPLNCKSVCVVEYLIPTLISLRFIQSRYIPVHRFARRI